MNISARYIRAWLERSSSTPPGNHRDRRPDLARPATEDPNAIQGEESPDDHDRQHAVVAPENSADLDLLEPDRPPAYTSKMAEETCGVTDKVTPSRRSTK